MTTKLKAPENYSGLTHGDAHYEPDKQGVVEVPDDLVPLALSHGLTPFTEDEAPRARLKLAKSPDA